MRFQDVPKEQQMYTLVLSNKSEYSINGVTKDAIMNSPSQFVELERGDIINKSFITEITADRQATKSKLITPELTPGEETLKKLLSL